MSICYIMLLQSRNKIVTMSRCLKDAAAINAVFFPGIDQDQGGTHRRGPNRRYPESSIDSLRFQVETMVYP